MMVMMVLVMRVIENRGQRHDDLHSHQSSDYEAVQEQFVPVEVAEVV